MFWIVFELEVFFSELFVSIGIVRSLTKKFAFFVEVFRWICRNYTVKLARAKLPAKGLMHRQKSPQVTIVCGCRRQLAETSLRPQVNSVKTLLLLSARFFPRERGKARFLLSSSKHFDESNHLLLLKSMVNPSMFFLFQKSWSVPCWPFKPLYKKTAQWKTHHCHQNDRELAIVSFSLFSLIPNEGEITSKSRSWSWIALETQCIFDEHYWFFL